MGCEYLWVDGDNTYTSPIYVAITVVAICIALPGNLLTAMIIIQKRELRNEPTYLLICSVCIADVLVASVVQPLFISTMLLGTRRYCVLDNIYYVSAWISAMASGVGVLPITLERYFYIVYPLHYSFYVTKRRAQIVITILWCSAFLFGILPLLWNDRLTNHSISLAIVLTISLFMIFVYRRIYSKVTLVAPEAPLPNRKNTTERRRRIRIQGQATKTVFFIVLSFFVCWFPYLLVSFIVALHNRDDADSLENYTKDSTAMRLYWGFLLLGYCNSAVNVFIYGRKNSVLRRAISNYFRKLLHRRDDKTENSYLATLAATLNLYDGRVDENRTKADGDGDSSL